MAWTLTRAREVVIGDDDMVVSREWQVDISDAMVLDANAMVVAAASPAEPIDSRLAGD